MTNTTNTPPEVPTGTVFIGWDRFGFAYAEWTADGEIARLAPGSTTWRWEATGRWGIPPVTTEPEGGTE